MKPTTSPYKHIFYNQNRARPKSGEKVKKALEWFIDLLRKEDQQGLTKWLYKTKIQALARLKKYGTSQQQVLGALERKGLNNLSRYLAQ